MTMTQTIDQRLDEAAALASRGLYSEARRVYLELQQAQLPDEQASRIENDLSAIAAARGHEWSALLHADRAVQGVSATRLVRENRSQLWDAHFAADDRVKVAIVSLLFNWPSTGGGTIHTKELAEFLTRDGYYVQHIYARQESFGVGNVTEPLGYDSEPLEFSDSEWTQEFIRHRFQSAVDRLDPDWVIVTDCWNTKPLLAEAVRGYPYFLRIAAQESICPLNNVRMYFGCGDKYSIGQSIQPSIEQCDGNQLADSNRCRECVLQNAHLSGGLHKAERILGGFHDDEYPHRLRQAFEEAEGILVVNPAIAELVAPFSPAVHVVPSGFDPIRFPTKWQSPHSDEVSHSEQVAQLQRCQSSPVTKILFAGLRDELMKGFFVLEAATKKLWERRQDFEVWVTSEPRDGDPEYVRSIGWQSQQELTAAMVAADLLVFPTVAQEALGRSAVESLGCGRPVVASRIGGLEWVVEHERTGLLFEPGDGHDLCTQLERLLDDAELRTSIGRAGHAKFQREFTWDAILAAHYRRLFGPARRADLPILQQNREEIMV
jgi:glycosyltransferase involved in cell wall biosynthesis